MRGRGVNYSDLMISFLHKPGYVYHIPHNNHAHCLLKVFGRAQKVTFVITAITTMGLIFYYVVSALWVHTNAPASEQLIMKVALLHKMNR